MSEGLSHISYVLLHHMIMFVKLNLLAVVRTSIFDPCSHIELRRLQIVDIKSDLAISILQVRSTGAIDVLTHQPVKGRRRGGGVRFGEMERDSLLSHGSAFLLQDRLFHCSDKTVVSWS